MRKTEEREKYRKKHLINTGHRSQQWELWDPDQPPLWLTSDVFTQWISTVLFYAETNSSYFLHTTAVSGIAISYSSSWSRRAACELTASSSAKSSKWSKWLNGNGKQKFCAKPSTYDVHKKDKVTPFHWPACTLPPALLWDKHYQ